MTQYEAASVPFLEQWAPVVDRDGNRLDVPYEVSTWGGVRRVDPDTREPVRELNPYKVNSLQPYLRVDLGGRTHRYYVHQLVAWTFIGPQPAGYDVHHKDGDGANNMANNLRYVEKDENTRKANKERTMEATIRTLKEADGLKEIVAYHGGQHDDIHWLTTDREHAERFGPVEAYRVIISGALRFDARECSDLHDEDGDPLEGDVAESALREMMKREYADTIVMEGWESDGLDIVVDSDWHLERVS